MPLTNAERQKRYRQRLKTRATLLESGGLYDVLVAHFRACADQDGKLRRRYKTPMRERLTPEELADEICAESLVVIRPLTEAIPRWVRQASGRDCPAELARSLEMIRAMFDWPDRWRDRWRDREDVT